MSTHAPAIDEAKKAVARAHRRLRASVERLPEVIDSATLGGMLAMELGDTAPWHTMQAAAEYGAAIAQLALLVRMDYSACSRARSEAGES